MNQYRGKNSKKLLQVKQRLLLKQIGCLTTLKGGELKAAKQFQYNRT
jgi:hypothetical protein